MNHYGLELEPQLERLNALMINYLIYSQQNYPKVCPDSTAYFATSSINVFTIKSPCIIFTLLVRQGKQIGCLESVINKPLKGRAALGIKGGHQVKLNLKHCLEISDVMLYLSSWF